MKFTLLTTTHPVNLPFNICRVTQWFLSMSPCVFDKLKILILFLLTAFLGSCAYPTKSDCESFNYAQLGYDAGRDGKMKEAELQQWQQKCSTKHGVEVNSQHFNAGYAKGLQYFCSPKKAFSLAIEGEVYVYPAQCVEIDEAPYKTSYFRGLQQFCTYEGGMNAGLKGVEYLGICRDSNEEPFMKGYNIGFQRKTVRDMATMKAQIDDLQHELLQKNNQINDLQSQVHRLESDLDQKDSEITILKARQ